MKNNDTQCRAEKIAENIKSILMLLGENISREGLAKTPIRVAKSLLELTSGYNVAASDSIANGIFETTSTALVIQKDLEFYSLCEHHMLPFYGKAHVAYLPNKKIIGLSKIARVIDTFSKRLQVQEMLTEQIANALEKALKPKALAIQLDATHFCMVMRGVKKQKSVTSTRILRGDFLCDSNLQNQLSSIFPNSPNI